MTSPTQADSRYRLSTAHVLRLVGPFAILAGLGWLVVAIVGPSRSWVVVVGVATLAVALGGSWLLARPPTVLALTETGYRIGFGRAGGQPGADWRQVESVATAEVAGSAALVFALADGRQSVLALSLLGGRNAAAQRDVHERLNGAYGYRPL